MRSITAVLSLALIAAALLVTSTSALPKANVYTTATVRPGFGYTPAAEVAHRAAESASKLAARGARATYYDTEVGLGSCGLQSKNTQAVVAMNSAQYKQSDCGRCIVLTTDDNCVRHEATIVDRCPGCPSGGVDVVPGLFQQFASLDVGVISLKWAYCDSAPPAPKDLSHCAK
ncbi:hypothetical protein H9P43_007008 [Blastocladiella emersonii ATCC 22665]|nr:hypothetical protein H9P43_007008 [Blastocladiella emersonii ATCC 22665]